MRTKVTKVKIPPQAKGWASRRSKYRAIPTTVNDIRFASKHEAAHYQKLLALEQAGKISDLQLQVRYPLHAWTPDGRKVKIGNYIPDFVFIDNERGELGTQIVDAKGYPTPLYSWKKKHFEAEYNVKITEV